jgi:hypothetical protein
MWWNPFSSSFKGQPVRGLANPNYIAGHENPEDLSLWMFDPRAVETKSNNFTADLVFNGLSGLKLPGGEIGWALGAQYRTFESRQIVSSAFNNGTVQCEWPHGTTSANGPGSPNLEANPLPTNDPNFRGCTPDAPGPFVLFAPTLPGPGRPEPVLAVRRAAGAAVLERRHPAGRPQGAVLQRPRRHRLQGVGQVERLGSADPARLVRHQLPDPAAGRDARRHHRGRAHLHGGGQQLAGGAVHHRRRTSSPRPPRPRTSAPSGRAAASPTITTSA